VGAVNNKLEAKYLQYETIANLYERLKKEVRGKNEIFRTRKWEGNIKG